MPTKTNKAKDSATVAPAVEVESSIFETEIVEPETRVREKRTYKPRYFASVKMREISVYRGPQYEDSVERVAIISLAGAIKVTIDTPNGERVLTSRRPAISISQKQVDILVESAGGKPGLPLFDALVLLKKEAKSRNMKDGTTDYATVEIQIELEEGATDLEDARMFPVRIVPCYSSQLVADKIDIEAAKVRVRFELEAALGDFED